MGIVIGLTQHQQHWVIFSELKGNDEELYDAEKSWLDYLQILAHRCRAQSERKVNSTTEFPCSLKPSPKSTDSCKKALYTFGATLGTQNTLGFFLSHSLSYTMNTGESRLCGYLEDLLKENWIQRNGFTYSSKWRSVEIRGIYLWATKISIESNSSIFWLAS